MLIDAGVHLELDARVWTAQLNDVLAGSILEDNIPRIPELLDVGTLDLADSWHVGSLRDWYRGSYQSFEWGHRMHTTEVNRVSNWQASHASHASKLLIPFAYPVSLASRFLNTVNSLS